MVNKKQQNDRIIFGLKVKVFRQQLHFSLSELADKAHLSVSYLNEIEKGKKFPSDEKLMALALALQIAPQELRSRTLPHQLEPLHDLLQSNFLYDLPLELFKIDLSKVVEIIASAPAQVNAFIAALVELSRNYAVRQENFYFAALRAYLALHNNYFEEIEQQVEQFLQTFEIPESRIIPSHKLEHILTQIFNYQIDKAGLDNYKALQTFRSVFVPNKKQLLLSSQLSEGQQAFQFGKELGFAYLQLQDRATTSSLMRPSSFEEVLNHSKSIYFSVALLMHQRLIVEDVKKFFQRTTWDGQAFLDVMHQYGASPEMFFHRLTNILPRHFGLKKLFFIRFVHSLDTKSFQIDRELHLHSRHYPHRNESNEHYCRRWLAVIQLDKLQAEPLTPISVGVQISHFFDTGDKYLCFTIAKRSYPKPNSNVSVTIGLVVDDALLQTISFLADPNIPAREVNITCERCPIENCVERVAPPVQYEKRLQRHRMQEALEQLMV